MKEESPLVTFPEFRRVSSEELEESRKAFEFRLYIENLQSLDLYEQLNGPSKCKKNDNSPQNSDNNSIDSDSSYKNNDNSSIDNDNSPKNDDNSSIDSDSSFEENYIHYKYLRPKDIRREPESECPLDDACSSCELHRMSLAYMHLDRLYYPSSSSHPDKTRLGPYDRISNLPSLSMPSFNTGDPVDSDRSNSNNDSNNFLLGPSHNSDNLSNSEGISNDYNDLSNSEGINNDSNGPLSGPNNEYNDPSSSENMNNEYNNPSSSENMNNEGNDLSNSEGVNNEGNDSSNSEGVNNEGNDLSSSEGISNEGNDPSNSEGSNNEGNNASSYSGLNKDDDSW
jgi:hypothetical protein